MVRIILSGIGGAMGKVVAKQSGARDDFAVVAGIDPNTQPAEGCPIFSSAGDLPDDWGQNADVIVDFSHPSALEDTLALAERLRLPLVLATTGLSEGQVSAVGRTAQTVPIFFSFNMSLGINLMSALAKTAARILGGQFDVEIIEKHHNRKIDAPSGTAILLANAVKEALPYSPDLKYERHSSRQRRGQAEIGVHSIRGGTIVGEHELLFAGQDETLRIVHTAYSREVFSTGALSAAQFILDKPAGLYDMNDLIKQL
ncbi:MAG: 4-hydroxy-tetrahydrodipicolinate reductase [Oscillospiraceae bacterium]|nr:4-hydroxy-tetrahydrodipicolinate reductase [Oscillospiraceae bacterium]